MICVFERHNFYPDRLFRPARGRSLLEQHHLLKVPHTNNATLASSLSTAIIKFCVSNRRVIFASSGRLAHLERSDLLYE